MTAFRSQTERTLEKPPVFWYKVLMIPSSWTVILSFFSSFLLPSELIPPGAFYWDIMAKRKDIDWEAIEKEYRSGVLSVREIANQHDISHTAIQKKAKEFGWKRDLTQEVRKEVARKLVAKTVAKNDATDKEIVDAASDTAVQVIELHRSDIRKLRDLEQDLIRRLDEDEKIAIVYQGKVTTELSVGLPTRADILQKLAFVANKRIALERQAFGIDEDGRRADPIEEISIIAISAGAE